MVRLTDRPHMTLDVYRGRKTTMQQQQQPMFFSFHLKRMYLLVFQYFHKGKNICDFLLLPWIMKILQQEGHDGLGSLTRVCEPKIFKLTDFGIKRAKVIIFTNYEGSLSSF